eukprot:230067_1
MGHFYCNGISYADNLNLYVSGIVKQGVLLKSVVGYINIVIGNSTSVTTNTSVFSDYFENNKLKLHITSKEMFTDISFSSYSKKWVAIFGRKLITVDVNNVKVNDFQLPLNGHKISLKPQNSFNETLQAAIAHSSYVSFYDTVTNGVTTVSVPITTSTSIAYCGNNFVYPFPEEDQWVDLYQVSLNKSTKCSSWGTYERTYAKVNPIHTTWIYGLTSALSPRDLEKWAVDGSTSDTCSMTNSDSPYHGDFNMNQPFWFSYDGTLIFMNTGLVLHASDDSKDMTVAGTFDIYGNSWNSQKFLWVTQMKLYPYYVYALKYTSNNYTITEYTWPYLQRLREIEIPSNLNISGFIFELDSFTGMESVADDNHKLYVSGTVKQGILLKSFVGYIDVSENSTNSTTTTNAPYLPKYIENDKLKYYIASDRMMTEFTDISFSSHSEQWIGIVDNKLITVDANNFESNNFKLPLSAHKISLKWQNNKNDPVKAAIAHSSYISFYNSENKNDIITVNVPIT